jgi:hypothetical protein
VGKRIAPSRFRVCPDHLDAAVRNRVRTDVLYMRRRAKVQLERRLRGQRDPPHSCSTGQRVPTALRIASPFRSGADCDSGRSRPGRRRQGPHHAEQGTPSACAASSGEIIVHRTFSLELGLGAKHFGMSRAGQARSTRTSILYTEKIDLLAVYERSRSLINSVPPFIR